MRTVTSRLLRLSVCFIHSCKLDVCNALCTRANEQRGTRMHACTHPGEQNPGEQNFEQTHERVVCACLASMSESVYRLQRFHFCWGYRDAAVLSLWVHFHHAKAASLQTLAASSFRRFASGELREAARQQIHRDPAAALELWTLLCDLVARCGTLLHRVMSVCGMWLCTCRPMPPLELVGVLGELGFDVDNADSRGQVRPACLHWCAFTRAHTRTCRRG